MKNWYIAIVWACLAPLCLAQSAQAPSLLSRGMSAESGLTRDAPEFQPSIGILSGYDNGPLGTDFERIGGPFQEIDGGLEARRSGGRMNLKLDYQFGLRHYTSAARLDRSNHNISLDARFLVSRRLTLILRDVGSSASYGNSLEQPATAASAGFFADAGPETFHRRTIANTALADLVFAPSSRTSIAVAGDGFVIERQFQPLADAVGWRARADLAHRYGRHKTVSLAYSFTHFDHSHSFGGADYVVFAAGHSLRLGKRSELDLLAGAGLIRSAGVRAVELDPEIARLLGTARGVEIFRLHTWAPHLMATWLQGIGRAEMRLDFARIVSDGGGLTGLARQNQGSWTFSAARARSWHPSAKLAVRTYRSLDTLLYDNTTALAGAALARRLSPRAEAVVRYEFAFYNFQHGLIQNFGRHQVAAGIVYYPFAPSAGRR